MYNFFIIITTIILYTCITSVYSKDISFQDANINYVGRWHNSTKDMTSNWPGAYFKVTLLNTRHVQLKFTNTTSISVNINGENYQFNDISTIDLVPEGNGPHHLTVIGTHIDQHVQFSKITVDDTGITVIGEKRPTVEFIGHDLVLGIDTTKTVFTSFAWLTSDALDLERSLVAYKNAKLVNGIEQCYFMDFDDNNVPWSVVILLGANDHLTDYQSNEYREVLNTFITNIRKKLHPEAPIFILSEPLGDMFRPSQQSVHDMVHGGDQHVYFIDTTAWLRYGPNYYKDSSHLSDAGHALFAKKLAPLLQIKLKNPRDPLPGPPPNPNLPGDWQTMDVGQEDRIGLPGTVSADSASTFTLWGSGADIDNERDAFRFVYQPFSDQGIIESTVQSHSTFAKCAKAGIMMREHLGHGSPLIMLGISPAEGIFVQIRYSNFGQTKVIKKMRASPPYRLRLIRKKDQDLFDAQIQHVDTSSLDITSWETFVTIPFVMARDVYAGLAVTSCDTSVVSVAKFTEVGLYHSSFIESPPPPRFIDQTF